MFAKPAIPLYSAYEVERQFKNMLRALMLAPSTGGKAASLRLEGVLASKPIFRQLLAGLC